MPILKAKQLNMILLREVYHFIFEWQFIRSPLQGLPSPPPSDKPRIVVLLILISFR